MAQSISGVITKKYKDIDGVERNYSFRTATVYNDGGIPGTISPDSARTTLQLDLGGLTGFVNIAERNASGGWTFTAAAGDLIKKDLSKRGPGSLTAQLDNSTIAALKTNARISDVQARQALDISQNITGTTALLAPDENIDGAGGGTDAPASGSGDGSSPPISPETSKALLDAISKGQKARTKYEDDLKYPLDYDGNDFLTIEMLRYIPSTNLSLGTGTDSEGGAVYDPSLGLPGITERTNIKEASLAKFILPIPSNLVDGNLVDWTSSGLNPLQAYGAGAIGNVLGSGNFISGLGNEIKGAGETLRQNSDAAKIALNASIIKSIIGAPVLTRSTGAIVNQNTELLFNSVQLRSFTFNFKMTPRSKKEAIAIRKIIRRLKQGMSAKKAVSGIFVASPNVFKLQFKYVPPELPDASGTIRGGTPVDHPYLPKLKICALQNLTVNYMPDGSYMTYGDGSMVGYEVTMSFAEIDPIFDDDYTKIDDDTDDFIGY